MHRLTSSVHPQGQAEEDFFPEPARTVSASEGSACVVEVQLFCGLEKPLAYRVPESLPGTVIPGMLVRVPLAERTIMGIVRGFLEQQPEGVFLKSLLQIVLPVPVLTPDLCALVPWMARYYAASLNSTLEAMVPAVVRDGVAPRIQRYLKVARELDAAERQALCKRAPKASALYEFLIQQTDPLPKEDVLERLHVSAASCASLCQKGLVCEIAETEVRTAYEDDLARMEAVESLAHPLTDEQQAAVDSLGAALKTGSFGTFLLNGVTGSGKTEVYLRLIEQVLQDGGSVLFLVPEVALTPQTVSRVRERLRNSGHSVVVWHSHLSNGERYDAWLSVARGDSRIVVGARSAVFAPLSHLRLIIVDEEHDTAYKQSETPRYHGRDVAVYRARLAGAVCVLGSATPSLESLFNVRQGRYSMVRLTRRVDSRTLPRLRIVDMKLEKPGPDGIPLLSKLLVEKLHERLDNREQTVLFLNRRGFAPNLLCMDCGHVPECPHCSVKLTLHRQDNRLKCHICGHWEGVHRTCVGCGSTSLKPRGNGTQRIEDVLQRVAPTARVARLDRDSLTRRHTFRETLARFRSRQLDILVGTQMIAKGLDFPAVTLVGVIDADISLQVPDFRSSERAFQLLVQVSGRAGRGDRPGEVVVQSFQPHAQAIQFARSGDFDGFFDAELHEREQFRYPPFRHLIRHIFRGRNAEKVAFYAEGWVKVLESELTTPIEIRGPAPCPLEKAKDEWRFHVFYFVSRITPVIQELLAARARFPMDDDVTDVIDVDALDIV